ncbi:MAG: major capsid protein [Candidatus Caldarchaeum sp.]
MDIFNIKEFATPVTVKHAREFIDQFSSANYMGYLLFPPENVDSLKWESIVGANNEPIPVMAGIKDINAESSIASREVTLKRISGKIPSIARKIPIDAETLIMLQNPRPQSEEYLNAVRAAYDDMNALVKQVAARLEWIRFKALTTGQFTYNEGDGLTFSVDFNVQPEQKVQYNTPNIGLTGVAWNNTTDSDPLKDIIALADYFERVTGVRPTRAICSRKLYSTMRMNKNLMEHLFGSAGTNRLISSDDFAAVFDQYDLPVFSPYNMVVQSENVRTKVKTKEQLVPDNVVVFLPPANIELGKTLFGPTVEEILFPDKAKLAAGPRIWGVIYPEGNDPVTLWTKVVANAFITFPGAAYIGIFTAW